MEDIFGSESPAYRNFWAFFEIHLLFCPSYIEVISNPPAKYSAEGNAGMINIISKKTKLDEWNASVDSGYQQRTYPIGYTSLSYNLKYKNLSLSSSLTLHKGSSGPWNKSEIYYPDQLWQGDFTRENYFGNVVPKIALDYKISEKFSTGVSYNFRFGNYGDRNARTTDEVSNLQTRANDFTIRTLASRDEKNYTHIGNYHLIFKPDTLGRKLSLDFDWFKHDHNQVQPFKSDRYLRGGQDFDQTLQAVDNQGYRNTNNYSVNLDMEHPTKWVNLNYGGRLSFVDIDSGFNAYDIQTPERILDESRSNVFLFKENTQALYASAQKTIGKKWEAKVGLRLESTQIEGYSRTLDQRTPINYTKLFPTAYVSYTPKENHNLSLNYGRRISRPDFDSYNPFRWTFSSFSYWEGNPFLLPSFTHNVEFTYSYKSLLTSAVYFSRTEDGFNGGISIVDPVTKINKAQPLNYYASNQFGVRQSANIDITKQIQLNLSADGVYIESRAFVPITLQRISGWVGYFSANVDITLNPKKTLFLNLSGLLVTDGVDSSLYFIRSFGYLDASFKALLFNKKLTVLLSGGDLLRTNIYRVEGYSNNQRILNRNYGDDRYFGLSLTYTFGKAFNLNTHEQKNKDELNRIN